MAKVATRFELVEQLYDGLNGKIIGWTKQHGGTSDDPSVQVFVVGADGKVIERASDADAHQPKQLVKWLSKHADAWEKAPPKTKVPFVATTLRASGSGETRRVVCDELDAARKAGNPVAIYLGREPRDGDKGDAKAEATAARKFEKQVLGAEEAAKAGVGWTLLKLDRSEPDHALLVATLGRATPSIIAPAIVLWLPDESEPVLLDRMTSAGTLAKWFRKAPAKAP
ncbi:MAG: hypothetical protein EXS13_11415 [Planctomycetes bacterium]|nr:hypothetical protein [Planctomycetota bacterium]